ncbi:MAG: DUF11 domain-containing protein, partial [Paludibacteraceae bacterium]|nr:DUF11 domain-containing protein [Paludibacteraceae bacterium]
MGRVKDLLIGVVLSLSVSSSFVMGQDGSEPYNPSKFISININSGDPTYPYPQFLEYKGGGKSLAKYNAEGVTHADMEKAGREAYEIMMHRCRYMGGTHCGVKYITFNHESVPGNYGTFVSEGDGYALLAAAIFADQKTFNGLYMWVHDHRFSGVERFQDGRKLRDKENDYAGPYLAGWQCDETTTSMSPCHSATDGDVDIAMAMLIAYKQWGEWMKQDGEVVKDYAGKPISLKYEAQRVIGALVDTLGQWDKGSGALTGYLCGVIGIDGYEKRGNSWGELTRWRFSDEANARYPNFNGPNNVGPNLYGIYGGNYIDYDAPAYFEEFWRWLNNGDGVDKNNEKIAPWEIHQFKRAAASGNWLNKQAYDQGLYASIGRVDMETDGQPKFGVYVDGEDFRYPWRHMMDYLWHGNADYDWDPKSHQVIEGTNTSERDMGIRHATLLKNPSKDGELICSKMGASPDPGQPSWFGVSQIPQQWTPTGGVTSAYHTNYSVGAGTPAAVISEDLDLLADIYRQCELMWDGNNTAAKLDPEERYIGSTPKYFHGWFRTLGMLVCTGNLAAPEDMKPIANAKVYMSVDKTYAYQGDDVTYGVQFRNYGTLDAEGVKITTKLDPNYTFVSATKGGTYNAGSHSITWNIGSIPGFKTGKLAATMDSVFFTVNVADTLNPRICLTSTLTASNCDEWVSNEYPNHATYTMERNCVDILANRSLYIEKKANRSALNPNDVVTFTVNFGNKSEGEASWMNGGRDNVRISYGTHLPDQPYQFYSLYRFWNDSYEAYINMSNYRVSYFMYDAAAIGLYDEAKNPTGWEFVVDNQNDLDKYGYNPASGPITFAYQKIPQGEDEHGKWNQRLMIRFADVLMAPSTHVYDKLDSQYLLHKGVWGPGFIRSRLASKPAQVLGSRVVDDWSYDEKVGGEPLDGQGTTFTLISPCWANYGDPGYEITNYSRHVCSPTKVKNYNRILVEEFDGYTWRRIQGTGPLPGREAYNVTISDTIPYELEWLGWVDSLALKDDAGNKIKAKYTPCSSPKEKGYSGVVSWTIPVMLVGEEDKLVYKCKARDLGCPDVEDTYYKNVAWIWSDTDSPDSSQVDLMTTCAELPPVIEPQTSLFKRANKKQAEVGETISYTLSFINTKGTRVEENCKSTNGWQKLGSGTLPAMGAKGFKLSTDGASTYFFGPEKSYGSNGEVYASFAGSPSSTQDLYIVFRYNGGTPGESNFKGVCMQMMINKDGQNNYGYKLYNDGKLIKSEGLSWEDAVQFPGDYKEPTFKFVLNDDHLYMYVNDFEDEWTNVLKDWGGLTSTAPGYFGMYVKSNGNADAQLSSFITELDYAFDIQLFDDLPAELDNVSAISGGGELKVGRITWPMEATTAKTALAPGDSIVRTFDAEVVSCNNYINNLALATVYGLDTLKALNTIACGASCPIESVTASLKKSTICEGEKTTIEAVAKPAGDYKYEFFLDGESLGAASSKATLEVEKKGKYTVVVTDPADATCKKESKAVELTVGEIPTIELDPLDAFCAGEEKTLPSGDGLAWFTDADTTTKADADLSKLEGSLTPYTFYFTNTNEAGCVYGPKEYAVTVKLTATAKFDTVMTCGETSIVVETTPADGKRVWTLEGEEIPAPSSFAPAGEFGELSLTVTAEGYCDSKSDEANKKNITVKAAAKAPVVADMEFVKGTGCQPVDKKEGAAINPNDSKNSLVWYDADKQPYATDGSVAPCHDLTKRDEGTTYWVSEVTPEGCASELVKFTVKVNDAPRPTVLDTTVCEGATLSVEDLQKRVVSESSDFKVRWYTAVSDGKGGGDYADAPALLADAAVGKYEYYVTQYNAGTDAESDADTLTVTVVGVKKPSVLSSSYCAGDEAKSLSSDVTTVVDEANGYFQSGYAWFVDGSAVESEPLVKTDVSATTETVYAVAQTYELANGTTCVGDTARFVVKVTKVDVPVVNGAVTYTTGDIDANGKIAKNLVERNPNAVKATSDEYTLVWYDADGNELGTTPPVPTSDPKKVEAGEDQEFTYYVKQTDGKCEGEKTAVKVVISSSPRPVTRNLNLCEGEDLAGRTLLDLVDIDANGGDASAFSLRWYADASKTGSGEGFTEKPEALSSVKTTAEATESKTYYVTQVNAEGAESGISEIVVTVYARPVLTAVAKEPVCGGSVDLKTAWQVENGVAVEQTEYTLEG